MEVIIIKYLEDIEIDLHNEDKILGINEDGHDYTTDAYVDYDKTMWAREVEEIDIDTAIETLTKLKESGANYVEIMHHCDHNSYVFTGLEMRKATEEEREERLKRLKINEEKEKQLEIERLERKIAKLKK